MDMFDRVVVMVMVVGLLVLCLCVDFKCEELRDRVDRLEAVVEVSNGH